MPILSRATLDPARRCATDAYYGITVGPDGKIWFSENGTGKMASITTNGTVTEYSTSMTGYGIRFIMMGPDRNIWVAMISGYLGKFVL